MYLHLLKDVLIILLLGFSTVLAVILIRLALTLRKAVINTEEKLDDIKQNFIEVKNSINTTVDNVNPVLNALLQHVDDIKVETVSTLEHIRQMVDETKTLTATLDNEAASMFETINQLGAPIKSALEIVSKPLNTTTRFTSALNKAFIAFKNKLSKHQ